MHKQGTMRENALFFTPDNLVLSLPLLLTTALYGFFKFVPLTVGVPLLLIGGLFLQTRARIRQRQDLRSNDIDESIIKELSAEDDRKKAKKTAAALKRERKAGEKLRLRIASDTALAAAGDTVEAKDDDDEDMLNTFVTRTKKGKGRR